MNKYGRFVVVKQNGVPVICIKDRYMDQPHELWEIRTSPYDGSELVFHSMKEAKEYASELYNRTRTDDHFWREFIKANSDIPTPKVVGLCLFDGESVLPVTDLIEPTDFKFLFCAVSDPCDTVDRPSFLYYVIMNDDFDKYCVLTTSKPLKINQCGNTIYFNITGISVKAGELVTTSAHCFKPRLTIAHRDAMISSISDYLSQL